MNKSSRLKVIDTGLRWLWLVVLFFIIDQVTKHWAVANIGRYETIEVMPFFNLVLRYNTGAAFSFLADAGGWQVFFFSSVSAVVSLGILYWLYTIPAKNKLLSVALSLILAGALGNLYDRIMLGKVVDFIDWYYDVHHWPAFNIADSVIMLGAVMMLIDGFVNSDQKTEPEQKIESGSPKIKESKK